MYIYLSTVYLLCSVGQLPEIKRFDWLICLTTTLHIIFTVIETHKPVSATAARRRICRYYSIVKGAPIGNANCTLANEQKNWNLKTVCKPGHHLNVNQSINLFVHQLRGHTDTPNTLPTALQRTGRAEYRIKQYKWCVAEMQSVHIQMIVYNTQIIH